ncbi:MAG: ABC transporter ATP-binding protein [Candidatus Eremiobacteraeota bacterium]|nr:ABC transporter ATP-binding protein [Candidatus Eremiobacteraeota bacterium]
MSEVLAEARDVSRIYRIGDQTIVAVEHADCHVSAGERIALQGPSGSGKSTLLLMLGAIETPTSGELRWPALGPPADLRPRHIAFVFQRESLLAPLSVIENIELALVLQGATQDDAHAASLAALNQFELTELAEKLPEELSGGQLQRVAFARAIAMRPALILADEPTGQLDSETAEHFLNVALPLLDQQGSALVIATHDARIAARMNARWYMMHGRLDTMQ